MNYQQPELTELTNDAVKLKVGGGQGIKILALWDNRTDEQISLTATGAELAGIWTVVNVIDLGDEVLLELGK